MEHGKLKKSVILSSLKWEEYERLAGGEWSPGMKVPFDPVATKAAKRQGMRVSIMSGKDLANLRKFLDGKPFIGSLIA